MSIQLSESSFNWSISHILKHGDTDILPRCFEFECIKNNWNEVLLHLKSIDLETHKLSSFIKTLCPKHSGGYRPVCQLDPIDIIVMTAFIGEEGDLIEKGRMPIDTKRSCAYRISKEASGDLFKKGAGWSDFCEKSKQCISSGKYKYVLIADIADFYNQISHHRIQNQMSSMGIEEVKTKAFEGLLGQINANHHSRGIPVGPSFSIALAEACLSDVDSILLRKGYEFSRYVDDYRIFCPSEESANRALYELTEYLYTAHRLTLQMSKTNIMKIDLFNQNEIVNPEELEQEKLADKIQEMLEDKFDIYNNDDPELDEDEEATALRDAISELFQSVKDNFPLNLGLARYVLRRSGHLRIRNIYSELLDNIRYFIPVMPDVRQYISKVHTDHFDDHLKETILSLISDNNYNYMSFIKYWCYDIAISCDEAFSGLDLLRLIESDTDLTNKERYAALCAKKYKIIDWVRGKKESWQNYSPWSQRAIIYSGQVLPRDERRHWSKEIFDYPNVLLSNTAKYVYRSIN